jgi:hypothetical protein
LITIKLQIADGLRSEAPAGIIGRVLASVQEIIEAIIETGRPKGKRSSSGMLGDSELMLVAVGGGSFEVKLASANQTDLLNQSPITLAAEQFAKLVSVTDDESAFRTEIAALKMPVASRYLAFLRAIEGRVVETDIQWASPGEKREGSAMIRDKEVRGAIGAMLDLQQRERQFDVIGQLIAGDIKRKTYEFWPDEPHEGIERFSGKATDDALATKKLGDRFVATIDEVTALKTNGEIERKHVLSHLQPV